MKKIFGIALVIMMITTSFVGIMNAEAKDVGNEVLASHSPIRINGDSDFTAPNGVSSGSGTLGDPYIIENWEIDADTYGCGIYIGNTTKYVIIQNSDIVNASGVSSLYYKNANIYLHNSTNVNFTNNYIYGGDEYCIYINECYNSTISGNNITYITYGLIIQSCTNVSVGYNDLTNIPPSLTGEALGLHNSENCFINNNNISASNNIYGDLLIDTSNYNNISNNFIDTLTNIPFIVSDSNNNQIFNNTIEGSPTYGVYSDTSSYNDIIGNNLHYCSDDAILLQSSSVYNNVTYNKITSHSVGIETKTSSSNNYIAYNNITASSIYGIWLQSQYNTIFDNYIISSGFISETIRIDDDYNNIINNFLIKGGSSGTGIGLASNNCDILNNEIYSFTEGIIIAGTQNNINNNIIDGFITRGIWLFTSTYNNIYRNTIKNSVGGTGIDMDSFNNYNTIYQNNFINNDNHASDLGTNYWNGTYGICGNYWDNYTGVDLYSGENQDILGSDGIGDTPYIINPTDYFPLMEYWENYTVNQTSEIPDFYYGGGEYINEDFATYFENGYELAYDLTYDYTPIPVWMMFNEGNMSGTVPAINITYHMILNVSEYSGIPTSFDFYIYIYYETPITNVWELQNISNDLSGDYIVVNDIDASITSGWSGTYGLGFEPILDFTGTFNGQKHIISDLFIDKSLGYCGLFGSINGAKISNITLINVDIEGSTYTGALVGYAITGNISSSSSSGIIAGTSNTVGGLVGYGYGIDIYQSFSTCNCVAFANAVGGLVGSIDGNILNCYATGNVSSGSNYGGGLVGYMFDGNIENSYATGYISGTTELGGLVGQISSGNIINSYYDTNTSGQSDDTGKGEPKTTEEMKDITTYFGWDIEEIVVYEQINEGYPVLHWQISDNSPVWYLPVVRTPHTPIRINSDSEFNATNGVTSGTGTSGDPYIIDNWYINATGYGYGIYIGNTTKYFTIENCIIYDSEFISNPYFVGAGVQLENVENGTINKNTIHNCSRGITVQGNNNQIFNTTIRDNSVVGIKINDYTNNTIIRYCNITGGVYLISFNQYTNNTTISNCDLVASQILVTSFYCYNISFYHNNIFGSGILLNDINGNINYDLTHQFGGNYWSDYSGVDNYHGVNQDKIGSDNIGDTPYIFLGGQDNYPLIYPFETNNTPLADAGNDFVVYKYGTYSFNGSESSDAGGTSLNYTWYNAVKGTYYGENPSFMWTTAPYGFYNFTLTVTDDDSNIDTDIVMVEYVNISVHTPIRINSDLDFTAPNGVVSGTGTVGDPYVIDRWYIDASGYGCGIYVGNTTKYFVISNCTIFDASGYGIQYYFNTGIYLYNSWNGTINNNLITNNVGGGIYFEYSENNTIINNIIRYNSYGVGLAVFSANNSINNNNISNNTNKGISIADSDYNSIFNNNIIGNEYGFYIISYSSNNIIYHNNFIGNTKYSYNYALNCFNDYNLSYQFGGNYYDNYTGIDSYHGINQDKIGSDNIGDWSYNFTGGIDYYPLMYPFETNNTPLADAGVDKYYTGIHNINGSESSDAGGTSLNYTWEFTYNGSPYTYWNESFDFDFSIEGVYFVNLTITDDVYNTDTDMMIVYAVPLTADAGNNATIYRLDSHQFNGTGSFGLNLNYTWTFNDGGVQTIWGSEPIYTFNNLGIFNLTLNVTDTVNGYWDIDWVEITVLNNPPVADAGTNQTVYKGDWVQFDGTSSYDIDGSIVSYTWTFNDGGIQTLIGSVPSIYQFNNFGIYVVMLTVEDNNGDFGYDNVTIFVQNQDPIADAGSPQSGQKDTYYISGNNSYDVDGTIEWYNWTVEYNSTTYWFNGTQTWIGFYFYQEGTWTIYLNVTDNDGAYDTDSTTVEIIWLEPVANAGVDQAGIKGNYIISGNNSYDQDGSIIWYNWTFNYNSTQYWFNNTNWFSFYFYQFGEYEITLNVTDNDSLYDQDTMWVNITWLNPVADAGTDITDKRIISLDGTGSYDGDGVIVNYTWSFTYGGVPTEVWGETPSFDFNITNVYTIMLTVTDNDGLKGYDNVTVTVVFIEPVAVTHREPMSGTNKGTFRLDGTSSYDQDGTIINYRWMFYYDGAWHNLTGNLRNFDFLIQGDYLITLNVTDDDWRYGEDTMWINITWKYPQSMPRVYIDDTNKGTKKLTGANSTDEDGVISTYAWEVGRVGGIVLFTDTGQIVYHDFLDEGTYYVNLTVTDDDGLTGYKNITFQIVFKPPVADAGGDRIYALTQGNTLKNITLNASASYDIDGYIAEYNWTITCNNETFWLNGEVVTFQVPNNESCVFYIMLNVTDDDGLYDTCNITVEVITPIDLSMRWIYWLIILTITVFLVIIILRKLKELQDSQVNITDKPIGKEKKVKEKKERTGFFSRGKEI